MVRQFVPAAAADSDANQRPVVQKQFLIERASTATSDPGSSNPCHKPGKGYWQFNGQRIGAIECYSEPRVNNRILLRTYRADGVEMGLFREADDSDEAAGTLFSWWEANIHQQGLLQPAQ